MNCYSLSPTVLRLNELFQLLTFNETLLNKHSLELVKKVNVLIFVLNLLKNVLWFPIILHVHSKFSDVSFSEFF